MTKQNILDALLSERGEAIRRSRGALSLSRLGLKNPFHSFRSLTEIDRDIAAIPPPKVRISLEEQPALNSEYIAVIKISRFGEAPDLNAANCYPCPRFISEAFQDRPKFVDGSTKFKIGFERSEFPHQSQIHAREVQNHDGYRYQHGGETKMDGRHFEVVIMLSKQMMATILGCMPISDKLHTRGIHSYFLLLPMSQSLSGRNLSISSREKFIRLEKIACQNLIFIRSVNGTDNAAVDQILLLTED